MTEEAKFCVKSCREWYQAFANHGEGEKRAVKELLTTANLIESLSAQLEQVTRERDAAICDINMLCQCDVCTRMCKYDKPNPYCECADFEWRGVREVEHGT